VARKGLFPFQSNPDSWRGYFDAFAYAAPLTKQQDAALIRGQAYFAQRYCIYASLNAAGSQFFDF